MTIEPTPPTLVVHAKPWWASMTIWINGIGIVVALLVGIVELDFIQQIPGVQSFMIAVLGVLNVLLRVFKTIAPVTIAGKVLAPSKELG